MQLTGLSVVAPSTVAVGETFSLAVKVLTEPYVAGAACFRPLPGVLGRYNTSPRGIRYMDNVLPEFGGSVRLSGGEGYEGPAAFSFSGVAGPYVGDRRPIGRIGGLIIRIPWIAEAACSKRPIGSFTRKSDLDSPVTTPPRA